MPGYKVVLECVAVKGFCPFYKKGSKITFCEPAILMEEGDALCFGALLAFGPFYRPLVRGISPKELGLGDGYVTCQAAPLDQSTPESPGIAFFKIEQIPVEDTIMDLWAKGLKKRGIMNDRGNIKRKFWPENPSKP